MATQLLKGAPFNFPNCPDGEAQKSGYVFLSQKTGGGFPMRQAVPTAPYPVQFGNAVANAVDLFKNIGMQFPNWNLDGDRGLAWFTWQFHNNVYDPGNVQPDHES